jgi:putative aldouronate transport system permease protein
MMLPAILQRAERPAWLGKASPAELAVKAVVIAVVMLAMIYPFVTILATSLATEKETVESGGLIFLWPREPTLDAYRTIFAGSVVSRALLVSLGITVVGTALSLMATIGMAYGLSRPIVGGKVMIRLVLFSLFFAPGIIPSYLVVKELGLLNTYAALILPVLVNAFNLLVMRQFFMSIPQELIDAAAIDGASELQVLTRIVLPLSKAVIAVIALFYAVAYWNAFFNALIYLNESSMWPLQVVVRLYVLQGYSLPGAVGAVDAQVPPPQSLQMAIIVVAILPILLLYPFLQRHFSSGVLTGSIKG